MYKRLRDLREDNDKTQKEIAEFLNIGTTQYRRWEVGEHKIPAEVIVKIAKYYNVSTDYILGITNDPTPRDKESQKENYGIKNQFNNTKIKNNNGNINF